MFKNHLRQAFRSLSKNRTYFILNTAGLTAGLVCFAFIALWVTDEFSYESFNRNYSRIVRVVETAKTETGIQESAVTSAPMAKALKSDYGEVENTVRVKMNEDIISIKEQQVLQPGILLADPSFFDVFTYHLIRGDVKTALNEPYSLVLTASAAKKYFGEKDPVGQTLKINMFDSTGHGALYKITGIMPDPPQNSQFDFNMIASFRTVEVASPDVLTIDGWGDASFYTYLLLKKRVDYHKFSDKIAQFYGKYVGDRAEAWRKIYTYKLQPLADIHLKSHLQYDMAPTGTEANVYIFLTIGIFILLLAGINYVNLATAYSVNKAKEVGIRKVIGAVRNQLIVQYLLESVIVSLAAFVLALVCCSLLQPAFFQVTGKDLQLFASPRLVIFLAAVTVVLGILSGLLPAFVISGFKPIIVLRGSYRTGPKGVILRKSLVVSQFIITTLLITGIIVIHSQMSYIKNKDLGYNKDPLFFLRVHGNADVVKGYAAFRNELLSKPVIKGAAISNSLLGSLSSGGSETIDENGNKLEVNTARLRVDSAYFSVYGLRFVAGSNFDKKLGGDSALPIILNESAVRKFGWTDAGSALGKPFIMGDQKGRVVGVVRDFHFSSLQKLIGPLAIYPIGEYFSRITLKTDISRPSEVTAWVSQTWQKYFPSALLDYDFADQALEKQYNAEKRFAKVFLYFSVLSLLIACLGLYGLIAYTTSQKTKEIGIRKVLGASTQGITMMLSGEFLKLVALAFIIATPLAWVVMNKWLEDFAYRIQISWWMFAFAGSIVILVALLTVSYKAIIAALANPVRSLRSE